MIKFYANFINIIAVSLLLVYGLMFANRKGNRNISCDPFENYGLTPQ